jgi:hypothetical protein
MGHVAHVQPTVFRQLDGEWGALVSFVDDARPALFAGVPNVEDAFNVAVLDHVIGNLDRHNGNWLVNTGDRIVPIDHGLILPLRNGNQGHFNADFRGPVALQDHHRRGLEMLVENRPKLERQLRALDIDRRAIDAMYERVNQALRDGQLGDFWLR